MVAGSCEPEALRSREKIRGLRNWETGRTTGGASEAPLFAAFMRRQRAPTRTWSNRQFPALQGYQDAYLIAAAVDHSHLDIAVGSRNEPPVDRVSRTEADEWRSPKLADEVLQRAVRHLHLSDGGAAASDGHGNGGHRRGI